MDLLDSALVALSGIHLYLSPYTKVEESFNLQAIHDFLIHGSDLNSYDHKQFPGVVPRTFFGAGLISLLSKPFQSFVLNHSTKITYIDLQLLSRGILGFLNALSLIYLRKAINNYSRYQPRANLNKSLGKYTSFWFAMFQYTQFHVIYYVSRTLPNMFAFPLTNIALSFFLKDRYDIGLGILAYDAVLFRVEVAVFFGCFYIMALLFKKITIIKSINGVVLGLGLGICSSALTDPLLWEKPIIPELEGFIFNVIHGKSSLWGTEPYTAYFYKYLPKILLCPSTITLAPFGFFGDSPKLKNIQIIGLSSLLYVIILSLQKHKEWRFIVYAVPGITLLAANGTSFLMNRLRKWQRLVSLFIIGITVVISFSASIGMLLISSLNYPGGVAFTNFHELVVENETPGSNITVHLDVTTCMTGASRFGEVRKDTGYLINYDKTENSTQLQDLWPTFDYIITSIDLDDPSVVERNPFPFAMELNTSYWHKISSIKGYNGIKLDPIKRMLQRDPKFIELLKIGIVSLDTRPIIDYLSDTISLQDKIYIYHKELKPITNN